jgi:hypothetical protein
MSFTLHDAVRRVKVPSMTAIPRDYEVVLTFSQRFGRLMPLLLKVPDFDGVHIHWGNTAKNTEGRILIGQTKAQDFIGASRAAFEALFPKLEAASRIEKVFIAIANAPSEQAGMVAVPTSFILQANRSRRLARAGSPRERRRHECQSAYSFRYRPCRDPLDGGTP